MITYAAAMIAVGVGSYLQSRSCTEVFSSVGSAALCYVVLAFGYLGGKNREKTPTRPWLAMVYALILSLPVASLFSGTLITDKELGSAAVFTGCVLGCLGATTLVFLDLRSNRSQLWIHTRRWFVPLSLVVGAGLVFSSVFLRITPEGSGWDVITRKTAWVTSRINVGTPLFFGRTIEWLQPLYGPGGYAFYLLGLATSLMLLIWLVTSRGSVERTHASSAVSWLAALINLASLWVITDIFWGWHFDLSDVPWAAAVATCLWFAGPLFGVFLLAPFVGGKREPWRLRALLIFQLPIAAFNFLMLFAYYGNDLNMAGLGMLIIGLQLESWACMDLLGHRTRTDSHVKEVPTRVEAMAA
jgi:hypothetical protein